LQYVIVKKNTHSIQVPTHYINTYITHTATQKHVLVKTIHSFLISEYKMVPNVFYIIHIIIGFLGKYEELSKLIKKVQLTTSYITYLHYLS
jgi:hypothetical protein